MSAKTRGPPESRANCSHAGSIGSGRIGSIITIRCCGGDLAQPIANRRTNAEHHLIPAECPSSERNARACPDRGEDDKVRLGTWLEAGEVTRERAWRTRLSAHAGAKRR